MKGYPWWVKAYYQMSPLIQSGSEILETLHKVRTGTPAEKVLAGVTIAGTIIEALYDPPSPYHITRELSLRPVGEGLSRFLSKELRRVGGGKSLLKAPGERESASLTGWYDDADVAQVALLHFQNASTVFLGPNGGEFLWKLFGDIWKQSNSLQVLKNANSEELYLEPAEAISEYVGKPRVEDIHERLNRYPPGPRTVLFRGPSGVGKSILARHVAERRGRSLIIGAEAIPLLQLHDMKDLITILRPQTIILNDINIGDSRPDVVHRHLGLLEGLRDPNVLLILTLMVSPDQELKQGSWYLPGMRPGRVDEIYSIDLPDEESRAELLSHYLLKIKKEKPENFEELVEATEGLSGAYLRAFAERIAVHGVETWERELELILYSAPAPGQTENPESGFASWADQEISTMMNIRPLTHSDIDPQWDPDFNEIG